MIPRVSVTQIDQWRLWRSADWMPESELIASIKGEFHPNRKMLCGMAFHAIIEDPAVCLCSDGWYAHDSIRFPGEIIDRALLEYERGASPEVKATRIYRVNGEDVEVVAKVDQLQGSTIIETKTRWATFDADKYTDGCQWRYYLDVFGGATSVKYLVFQLDENAAGAFSLRDVHKLECYPYPGLDRDCHSLLGGFMEYCRLRKLTHYLRPRSAA